MSTGVSQSQTCQEYTAGDTADTELDDADMTPAIYANREGGDVAGCSGTVYAWHYCYYDDNSVTNLEVAFGVFSYSNKVYTLREGSYYLLHLDTRQTAFTCDTVTLDPLEYFEIQQGDRVGACLRQNGDIDYLNILGHDDNNNNNGRVHYWGSSGSSCTEEEMTTSPTVMGGSFKKRRTLHLYVDISMNSM